MAVELRRAGLTVLAKTTGSQPRILIPSGDERAIARRGNPTPLVQRRVLYQAARRLKICLSKMLPLLTRHILYVMIDILFLAQSDRTSMEVGV